MWWVGMELCASRENRQAHREGGQQLLESSHVSPSSPRLGFLGTLHRKPACFLPARTFLRRRWSELPRLSYGTGLRSLSILDLRLFKRSSLAPCRQLER
jgi:hypothetical protein